MREARRSAGHVERTHGKRIATMVAAHGVELSKAVNAASVAAVGQERVSVADEVRAEAVAAVISERAAATQRGIHRKKAQNLRS